MKPRTRAAKEPYLTTEELTAETVKLREENEKLRTVLRSLISSGGTSRTIKAMAMNTLEPGSGDKFLDATRCVCPFGTLLGDCPVHGDLVPDG